MLTTCCRGSPVGRLEGFSTTRSPGSSIQFHRDLFIRILAGHTGERGFSCGLVGCHFKSLHQSKKGRCETAAKTLNYRRIPQPVHCAEIRGLLATCLPQSEAAIHRILPLQRDLADSERYRHAASARGERTLNGATFRPCRTQRTINLESAEAYHPGRLDSIGPVQKKQELTRCAASPLRRLRSRAARVPCSGGRKCPGAARILRAFSTQEIRDQFGGSFLSLFPPMSVDSDS